MMLPSPLENQHGDAPWHGDQEWANALTHGLAAAVTVGLAFWLIPLAADDGTGMVVACAAYLASVFGTFVCSALSHVIRPGQLLNRVRSWDQGMIYAMIAGTYTPIVYRFADDQTRSWLLIGIWIAAAMGFLGKVALKHRVNSIGTVSYLALGWLPAIPLAGQVPSQVVFWTVMGGVLYTLGVVCLMNDRRMPYMHAVWHLFVMTAAFSHYWAVLHCVVPAT